MPQQRGSRRQQQEEHTFRVALRLAQLSIRSLVNDVASPRNLVQFGLHRRKAHRPANKPVDRMQCTFDAATTSRASLADASDRKAPDGPDDGRRSRSRADIRLNLRTA